MVSELREKKKPNYFRFIRESILGNLLVTVFHSGHLPHLLKFSGQPYRRQKTLTASDFSRRSPFPTLTIPSGVQGGDLQVFSKHRRENLNHTPATRVSSPTAWTSRAGTWGRMEHFPAMRFHLQPCLTPSTHSPSMLVPSEPCKCIFFLGFCLCQPSKQPFRRPPMTSSPTRALHVS